MSVLALIFGGRKTRKAYRDYTLALVEYAAALRELNAEMHQ